MLRDLRAPRNDRLCIASYQATTRLFQIPRINSFQFPVLLHMLNDSAFVRRVTCWARNHRPSEPAKSHCLQLQGSKFPLPQSLHVRLQSGIYTVSTSSTAQRTPWIGSTNAMDGCCRCSSPTHPPGQPSTIHGGDRSRPASDFLVTSAASEIFGDWGFSPHRNLANATRCPRTSALSRRRRRREILSRIRGQLDLEGM